MSDLPLIPDHPLSILRKKSPDNLFSHLNQHPTEQSIYFPKAPKDKKYDPQKDKSKQIHPRYTIFIHISVTFRIGTTQGLIIRLQ